MPLQPNLMTWAPGAHGFVALLALTGGLARYSERADIFKSSVQETEELLQKIRRAITAELEENIGKYFEKHVRPEPTMILDAHHKQHYREIVHSPVGSDHFRETLQRFIDEGSGSIRHYVEVARAHRNWCFWARLRRWIVFVLALWEVLCAASFVTLPKLFGTSFPDAAIAWSFAPTLLAVVLFFICGFGLLVQQDVIDGMRSRIQSL